MQKFKVRTTPEFDKKFKRLSELERKRYRKTLGLLENPAHRSLRTHAYEEKGKGVKGSYASMRERAGGVTTPPKPGAGEGLTDLW